jgi:hypothetical protein
MSSSQRNAHNSHGSWDGLKLDPRKVVIAEDNPEHPAFARHARRRTIKRGTVEDYKRRGVIVPIHVYLDGGDSTAAAGRRRVRHACVAANEMERDGLIHTVEEWELMSKAEQKASKKGPPFLIRAIAVSGSPEDTEIAENHHREDESPLGDAYLLSDKIGSGGASIEQAMSQLGIEDRRTADNYILLVQAHPDVQQAVDSFEVSFEVIRSTGILGMKRADQAKALKAFREGTKDVIEDGKQIRGGKAKAALKAAVEGKSVEEVNDAAKAPVARFVGRPMMVALRDRADGLSKDAQAILNYLTGVESALEGSAKVKALVEALQHERKGRKVTSKLEGVAPAALTDDSDEAVEPTVELDAEEVEA